MYPSISNRLSIANPRVSLMGIIFFKWPHFSFFFTFSNHSNKTVAFITVIYNQNSTVNDFHSLYDRLYKYKRLEHLHLEVIDENSMW